MVIIKLLPPPPRTSNSPKYSRTWSVNASGDRRLHILSNAEQANIAASLAVVTVWAPTKAAAAVIEEEGNEEEEEDPVEFLVGTAEVVKGEAAKEAKDKKDEDELEDELEDEEKAPERANKRS